MVTCSRSVRLLRPPEAVMASQTSALKKASSPNSWVHMHLRWRNGEGGGLGRRTRRRAASLGDKVLRRQAATVNELN